MSQFRKKKTGVSRDKQSSVLSISKRMATNNTADFRSEMDDIGRENDGLLGSLVGPQDPDRQVADLLRQMEQSQREEPKGLERRAPSLAQQQENNLIDGQISSQSDIRISRQYEAVDTRSLDNPTHVKANKLSEGLLLGKSYGDDRQVALLVLALKKIASTVEAENSKLKRENTECEFREAELKSRIRTLTARVQELELETKASRDKHTDYVRFDLEDLDARLRTMDEHLIKATGENSQQRFLDEIVNRNREYVTRSQENATSMKQLRENLTSLKSTLLTLNTRQDN